MLSRKRVDELYDSIMANKAKIAEIDEKISYVKKVVNQGNGTPSLVFRVTEIEVSIRALDDNVHDLEILLRETTKSVVASSLSLIPAFIALALSFFQLSSSFECPTPPSVPSETQHLFQISIEVIREGWEVFLP